MDALVGRDFWSLPFGMLVGVVFEGTVCPEEEVEPWRGREGSDDEGGPTGSGGVGSWRLSLPTR